MAIYKQTVVSKLSNALSPVIRELGNLSVSLAGTKVLLIRTNIQSVDEWEETEEGIETQIIDNAVLIYPNANIRVSNEINSEQMNQINALSIMDLIPVKMRIKFQSKKETYEENTINVKVNDIIVDVKIDENQNKIPIILTVSKIGGYFFEKNLVGLEFQLTRKNGILENNIEEAITNFIVEV